MNTFMKNETPFLTRNLAHKNQQSQQAQLAICPPPPPPPKNSHTAE